MGIDIRSVAPELLGYSALLCALLISFGRMPVSRRRLSIAVVVLLGIAIALAVTQESMGHRLSWTNIAVTSLFTAIFLLPGGVLGGWALIGFQRRGLSRWMATLFACIVAAVTTWIIPPIIILVMVMSMGFPGMD